MVNRVNLQPLKSFVRNLSLGLGGKNCCTGCYLDSLKSEIIKFDLIKYFFHFMICHNLFYV